MKKLFFVWIFVAGIVSCVCSLTDAEKQQLAEKYLSGGQFTASDLMKLQSLQDTTTSTVGNNEPVQQQPPVDEKKDRQELKSSYYEKYYFNESSYEYDLPLTNLKPFGYNFFDTPAMYSPVNNTAVPDDYILGTGDVLHLMFWGGSSNVYDVDVNQDGKIATPEIGSISVAGMTYKSLKQTLAASLTLGTNVEVSLVKMKTIRVFVTGNAKVPGSYTLSGLSTLVNAIFAAGGPSYTGSMRMIQVKRSGRVIRAFDLYDFLLYGDSSKDVLLLPGDVINFAPIKNIVAITGTIKVPALYEVKDGQNLQELIDLAGGLTATADMTNIHVEQFQKNVGRKIVDVKASDSTQLKTFILGDGDIIRIYPLPEAFNNKNAVRLVGHVAKPRKFEYTVGMKVSDMVSKEFLLRDTFLHYASIERRKYPENTQEMVPVNLYDVLIAYKAEADIALQPEDVLHLYSVKELKDTPPVFVMGEVRSPGRFAFIEGLTLFDMIYMAGGLTNVANLGNAEFITLEFGDTEAKQPDLQFVNVRAVLENPNDPAVNVKVKPFSKLFIRRVADFEENVAITLNGEVKFPGVYYARRDENLYDIIKRAGGFTDKAYIRAAFFSRVSVKEIQKERLQGIVNDLQQNLEEIIAKSIQYPEMQLYIPAYKERIEKIKRLEVTGRMVIQIPENLEDLKRSPFNIAIENGDVLTIPKQTNVVLVMGEVYNPNVFVYNRKKNKVKDYLEMTGGPSREGVLSRAIVIKANGVVISPYYIDKESSTFSFLSSGFMNAKIFPGDTIIVPRETENIPLVKKVIDWSTVLYQLSTTVKITSDLWGK